MQAREDTWAKGPAGALAVTVEEWQGEPRPGWVRTVATLNQWYRV